MSEYKLVLPPMGEGIMEATITGWTKNEGDWVEEDDIIVEIATDKVDSDVPSPKSGKLIKKLKEVDDICKIGEAFAVLEIENENSETEIINSTLLSEKEDITTKDLIEENNQNIEEELEQPLHNYAFKSENLNIISNEDRYYSPLVRTISKKENISQDELNNIKGTGLGGRITKEDLLSYIEKRKKSNNSDSKAEPVPIKNISVAIPTESFSSSSDSDEIIEMGRMRKLISENMLRSKQIAPHVTSFVEADVTNIVLWRKKMKDAFFKKEGQKLTFTPIFIQAVVKAIKDFPMINISVDGNTIIKKKNINIGMATALADGNLIVPVIKNADQLSLSGLARVINSLADKARKNQLKPEDTKGGTYTVSNIGGFGNIAGTPIINQPEVAILAIGSIVKKPAVIETPQGDLIGIRHKMILSHTFDHRVIDGALGGMMVKRIADYLESFDLNIEV